MKNEAEYEKFAKALVALPEGKRADAVIKFILTHQYRPQPARPLLKFSKGAVFSLAVPLAKADAEKRLVVGRAAQEVPDSANEIMDFASAKPAFMAWSDKAKKASCGKSLGNIRSMHSNIAAGKVVEITFDDAAKAIDIVAKITDDAEWKKCCDGTYVGFSIGGKYAKKWSDGNLTRYTPSIVEISLVDSPAIPGAYFSDILKQA